MSVSVVHITVENPASDAGTAPNEHRTFVVFQTYFTSITVPGEAADSEEGLIIDVSQLLDGAHHSYRSNVL